MLHDGTFDWGFEVGKRKERVLRRRENGIVKMERRRIRVERNVEGHP
jgi:hypothetical protein